MMMTRPRTREQDTPFFGDDDVPKKIRDEISEDDGDHKTMAVFELNTPADAAEPLGDVAQPRSASNRNNAPSLWSLTGPGMKQT